MHTCLGSTYLGFFGPHWSGCFSLQFWEVFSHYCFKYIFCLLFSWNFHIVPIVWLCPMSSTGFSSFFFILFFFLLFAPLNFKCSVSRSLILLSGWMCFPISLLSFSVQSLFFHLWDFFIDGLLFLWTFFMCCCSYLSIFVFLSFAKLQDYFEFFDSS